MRPRIPDPPEPVEVWWVRCDEPVTRLVCPRGGGEATVMGVLYDMRRDRGATVRPTTDPALGCVDMEPTGGFAVQVSNMRAFVAILRANRVHGSYRRAGDDREYRF